ncbi:MAG: DUF559 domain-containing protein [Xanthobacteraceae bacterium]|nr:DUF559 domain-containing protein [Xanthobacteraceae bacterium]
MRNANRFSTTRSRKLRAASTNAELHLWSKLRSRSLDGHKFVRQEPIGPFVVDFVCREIRLVIEVDGGQHATDPRDPPREQWLTDHGYQVIRFWNNDVLGNMDGVLQTILSALAAQLPPHPARDARRPLPASGER